MTILNLIPSFPDGIDREAFGHWLSGFTDGEGTFGLEFSCRGTGHAQFALQLRRDEWPCLETVRSFLGCGRVYLMTGNKAGNPLVAYKAFRTADLRDVIIPNFERYPLRARKAQDFLIWKEAVRLMVQVRSRKMLGVRKDQADPRTIARMSKGKGFWSRWTPEDKEEFARLDRLLKAGRKYGAGRG